MDETKENEIKPDTADCQVQDEPEEKEAVEEKND